MTETQHIIDFSFFADIFSISRIKFHPRIHLSQERRKEKEAAYKLRKLQE